MKRREFIRRSGLATLGAWAGSSFLLNACHTDEDMIGKPNWIVGGSFDRPLPVPGVVGSGARLVAGTGMADLISGRESSTLTYAGGILGPTIRAQRGETVSILLENQLEEKTNIHWHGLILPEDMDGHPRHTAAPGTSLQYTLPVIQRAGTYWYHPHPHGATARQVFMGLAGMFIVNDAEEENLGLPSGEYEVPLIIQDKRFAGTSLDYSPDEDEVMTGYLGERILVNGMHSPFLEVAPTWYRLRLLNGATARVFNLRFSNGRPFHIIGSDGGLLANPETVTSCMLAPGERLDVLVDFSGLTAGSEVVLGSAAFSEFNVQGRQNFDLMKFRVDRSGQSTFIMPSNLSNLERINPSEAVNTRTFDIAATAGGAGGHEGMGRHSISGKVFEMHRIDQTVTAGTTEIWEFDNAMGDEIHPMHIHGVQFQVLSRVGGQNAVMPAERGWKDTVLVMPREKVRVIMTFPSYRGIFVFHCHNLEHEDDGMMLNYEIA